MKLSNWLKNQIAAIAFSFSSVEKNLLGQNKNTLEDNLKNEQDNTHKNIANALLKGVLTEEVKKLRWRNYKILKTSSGVKIKKGAKLEERGSVAKINHQHELNKIKVDSFDDYKLELVVNNKDVVISTTDILDSQYISVFETPKVTDKDDEVIASHGEIKADEYFATFKAEKPIKVLRSFTPRFNIEEYATKMNVRNISETEKMLEFYISKYPDEKRPTSKIFINQINKVIKNNANNNFLSIDEVGFVSDNTLGTDDLLMYSYKIKALDKIVEYDGNYVIKYIAEVISDGYDMTSEFINDELENNYKENKAKY